LLGVVLTGAGIALSRVLLVAMDTPTAVLNDSVLYLRIYAGGFLFNVVYNMATGILNAAGNSRRPLLYLGAASVTNIVLDLVLIEGYKMGVAGAAVATDVSQLISCLLAVSYLLRVKSDYRIRVKSLCLDGDMARRIVRVGLPTGIQNMVISFSNVLVQTSVNHYGAMAMAGFTAYLKVDGFNILPVLSISMAVTTFVGQNYGAGNLKRVKSGMWTALLMSTVYTILTGTLLLAFSHPVMRLFTSDSAAIHYGVLAMKYFCPYYVLLGALNVLAGTVRGTGKSIPPMLILLFSMCIFRIIWIQLAVPHYDNIDGVFILYPISWVIGVVLMALYTWKGHWLHYGNEEKRAKEA
jgi:putative MATE family efflux protein